MFDINIEEAKLQTVHMERRLVQKAVSKEATALSLQQKKLLFFLISNVGASDTDFKRTTISIPDYFRLIGSDEGGKDRKLLKKEIQNFADKSFWIDTESVSELYRFVNIARIDYEKNEITMELHETMKEFLLGLDKKSRAIFQLGYALTFKHKYSPDLYSFAASIKDFMLKTREMYKMPIDDAMRRFGDGKYMKAYDWKRRILDPSLKEINEKTDLNLYVEFLKKDKRYKTKVTHVLFGVTRKVGADLARVRVDALNINDSKTIKQEAQEWAGAYIEEYAANELGFDPDDADPENVLEVMEKYEQKTRVKKSTMAREEVSREDEWEAEMREAYEQYNKRGAK